MKPLAFNRNFGKWFVNDVLRAIKKYRMIREGETIRVALSGGKDSAVLLYILAYLRRFSHLQVELEALHVRTAEYETGVLRDFCKDLDLPYREAELRRGPDPAADNPCYICSRLKRGALVELLPDEAECRVAWGHHADDAAETLFMNMIQNRRLGSFSPRVSVQGSPLMIIRPMIYLAEETVSRIHTYADLPLLDYRCPHEKTGLRRSFKKHLVDLNITFGVNDISRRVVDAIENIDMSNLWPDLE